MGAIKQELEIVIGPDGEVSIEVNGVAGKSCVELTKFLEDALGGEIKERQYTREYYQQGEQTYTDQKVGED